MANPSSETRDRIDLNDKAACESWAHKLNVTHEKLREAYRELAEREPGRCVLIEGSADPATVANGIWATVNERLRPAEAPFQLEDAAP